MQNQQQPPSRPQLTVAQVITAALASVSAAALASSLGVAGTLLGAAITSMVATVAGALYTHSLEQAHTRLRRQHFPRPGRLTPVLRPPPGLSRLAWGRVARRATLVFALTLGTITMVEVAARQPLARLMGHPPARDSGTTVGTLLHTVAEDVHPETAPRPTPTPEAATAPALGEPGQALTKPAPNERVAPTEETRLEETRPAVTAPALGEPGQTPPTPVPTAVVGPTAPAAAPTRAPSVPTTAPRTPVQP